MRSNYDVLGNHIRTIDTRNTELVSDKVLGINIDKFFMPSVANVIGTDLSRYKIITNGRKQLKTLNWSALCATIFPQRDVTFFSQIIGNSAFSPILQLSNLLSNALGIELK